MTSGSFDGSYAKLARCERLVAELKEAEDAYARENPPLLDVFVMYNGDNILYAEFADWKPYTPDAITADAINNLRSSLDIAVVQACLARGQSDMRLLGSTYFAVAGSERDWWGNVPRRMAGADQVIRETVSAFKPWKESGNILLYALTKIAAADKHVNLVHVTGTGGEFDQLVRFVNSDDSDAEISLRGDIWYAGAPNRYPIMATKSPGQIQITGPLKVRPSFGFGNVYGLRNTPAVPALNEMLRMCQQIVKTLEVAANSK